MKQSSIFEAIAEADLRRVEDIVRADASVLRAVAGASGQSPLMRAIHETDRTFEIVEFLVRSGADVNFATAEGYTPLHANIDVDGLSGSGDMPYRIARLLKEHGADVEASNHYGWTPLMQAALEGTADEFNALLDIGATFRVRYPDHSMPVFTRGRSLAWVVLAWPPKLEMLLGAGFRPEPPLLEEARAALADTREPDSVYARGVRQSIALLEHSLRGR